MSLNKSARRLSLLAGSSLVAGLTALAFTGAPTAAYAYDECVAVAPTLSDGVDGVSDPSLNAAVADSFSCTAATYATGIAYTSAGNLTVTKPSGTMTITTNGIDLIASGADTVTWNSAGIVSTAGLTGPLVNVLTDTGAISINPTSAVTASTAGTTYGIYAKSTGGGSITMTPGQAVNNNVLGGLAAIYAETNGGNISITTSNFGAATGRQRGVHAQTSGAGSVTLGLRGAVASAVDGVAAIDVAAGTGGINITLTGGALTAGAGLAIRAVSTGAAVVTYSGGTFRGPVDFAGVTGGVTLTASATSSSTSDLWVVTGASVFSGANDTITTGRAQLTAGALISLGAGADTFNANGSFDGGAGTIDFGIGDDRLVTGGNTFASATMTGTTINFGAGADVFDMARALNVNGLIVDFGVDNDAVNVSGSLTTLGAALDFGSGADAFNITSTGRMTVSGLSSFTATNLEAFNNAGVILMGGQGGGTTNLAPGDILSLPGATYTGSGDARIVIDINFAGGGQEDCSSPTAADCLDFTGGGTAGSTLLTIRDAGGSSTAGSSSRVAIVVGATSDGNFTLDPDSSGYVTTAQGPALRKRLFDFYLLYDPADLKYVFAPVPHEEAFQFATFAATSQDVWRSTTGSWFERQADLRATPGGVEPSRGLWARAGVSVGQRDSTVPLTLLGTAYDKTISYDQRTSHVVFGADLLGAASQGGSWVVGASAGFMRADAQYDAPSVEAIYAGVTGGLYASLVAGPVFVDVAVNGNVMDAESDVPSLGFDDNVKLSQTIVSVGAQAQAGWRFGLAQGLFVEPLVNASYVQSDLEDIVVPGSAGELTYDEGAASLRAGAGVRVGMDSQLMGMAASYSLTGGYSSELEGENATVLPGNTATTLVDDFGGGFGELMGSVNLYSGDGGVSGFLNLGGKFADGYSSIDGSVGVRVRW